MSSISEVKDEDGDENEESCDNGHGYCSFFHERPTKAWDINFPSPQSSCPLANPLSLNVCVALLGIHVVVGDPHTVECCDIITGLGVDATICLCTAIHLKVLGLHVDVPLALKLLVKCGGDMFMPNGLNC